MQNTYLVEIAHRLVHLLLLLSHLACLVCTAERW
jgi:hypothetical protein